MKLYFTLLFTVLCCLGQFVKAEDASWFEIEVIVFAQLSHTRLETEKWEQQVPLVDINKSIDFLTPDASAVAIEQLCLQGKMQPVIEMLPVVEVADVIDIVEENIVVADESTIIPTVPLEPEEQPFKVLDSEFNQLTELKNSLSRSRGYRPLLHISWRQPVEDKASSQLIRVYAGNNYSDTFNPAGDARVNIATIESDIVDKTLILEDQQSFSPLNSNQDNRYPFDINRSDAPLFANSDAQIAKNHQLLVQQQLAKCQQMLQSQAEQKRQDVWQLDGNIQIYVERYLHLQTDLELRIPGKEELQLGAIETNLAADKLLSSLQKEPERGFGWQLGDDFLTDGEQQTTVIRDVLNHYLMQQSRRIRSNEIHYIDHPLFGLLIQIRPYDRNAKKADTELTNQ